jgi:DNA-binding winged helix-turn-helix (wHTH) protein
MLNTVLTIPRTGFQVILAIHIKNRDVNSTAEGKEKQHLPTTKRNVTQFTKHDILVLSRPLVHIDFDVPIPPHKAKRGIINQ